MDLTPGTLLVASAIFAAGWVVGWLSERVLARVRATLPSSPPVPLFAALGLERARPDESVQERLRGVCRFVDGELELPSGGVSSGHVAWQRGGRRFQYFEQLAGGAWWGVVSLRHPKAQFPALLARRRDGALPHPPPPFVVTGTSGSSSFDRDMEARVNAEWPTAEPPVGTTSCDQFVKLAGMVHGSPVLEAQHSRARVLLPGVLSGGSECREILEEACRLLEILLAERLPIETEAGMEYVDDPAPAESTAVVCPVCGEGIGRDGVECDRCGTPHHQDCWKYTGRCAIFACSGREARVPRG